MPASVAPALEAVSASIRQRRHARWRAAIVMMAAVAVACSSKSAGEGAPDTPGDDSGVVVRPGDDASLSNPPPFAEGLLPDAGARSRRGSS